MFSPFEQFKPKPAPEEKPAEEKPVEGKNPEEDQGLKKEEGLWDPKEEGGHIRSAEEIEAAKEMITGEEKPEPLKEIKEMKEEELEQGSRTPEKIKEIKKLTPAAPEEAKKEPSPAAEQAAKPEEKIGVKPPEKLGEKPAETLKDKPEIKPGRKDAGLKLEKEHDVKTKEGRLAIRLDILKINPRELSKERKEKMREISGKIDKAGPWVVRVMEEIKKKAGQEQLLKQFGETPEKRAKKLGNIKEEEALRRLGQSQLLRNFGPKDVELLEKMSKEAGYNFRINGIAGDEPKKMALRFMEIKRKLEQWNEGKIVLKERGIEQPKAVRKAKEEKREEKEAVRSAGKTREEIIEEISRKLAENPTQALSIFKKGVGLKLEKAYRNLIASWKKAGAEALKAASWTGERAVGYPAGEAVRAVLNTGETFELLPGDKRWRKVMEIHAQVERLRKGELTPNQEEELRRFLKNNKWGARDQWKETQDFNKLAERKQKTLKACRTFNQAREKLSKLQKEIEAKNKKVKEKAVKKRAKSIAEKLK